LSDILLTLPLLDIDLASWSIIGVVHVDSKKLSGVYGMSAEDTFDEDPIDWDTFDWDDMPAAEDTETNEANKDSVATLNHDPDHDDWDDDLEMDRSALLKAIIDKCEKDGHATSSTVDAEAVDEFVLATFGTTKVKRGLMGEQLQQIREAFAADDKGSVARYAKLVAAIGCRSVRQVADAFTELRRESGTVPSGRPSSGRSKTRSGLSLRRGRTHPTSSRSRSSRAVEREATRRSPSRRAS